MPGIPDSEWRCKGCGGMERNAQRRCRACKAAYDAAYRAANPEMCRAYSRAYKARRNAQSNWNEMMLALSDMIEGKPKKERPGV